MLLESTWKYWIKHMFPQTVVACICMFCTFFCSMSVCPHTWFVCRNLSSLARWQSVPALMLQRQIHPAFPLRVILHPIQVSILFGGATSVAVLFEVAALGSQPVSCLILSQPRECNWLKRALKINMLKRFWSIQRCLKAAHDQRASDHAMHTGYILPT